MYVWQRPILHLHRTPRSMAVSLFLVLSQSQQVRSMDACYDVLKAALVGSQVMHYCIAMR